MFKRYPDSYRLPVYEPVAAPPCRSTSTTRRPATPRRPSWFAAATAGELREAIAFPIPKDGLEVIWNHITRYRGGSARRVVAQATPQVNGNFSTVKFVDEVVYTDTLTDYKPEKHGNVLFYFKQQVTEPSALPATCCWCTKPRTVKEPRMAWIYNAGQRRVRRAPQVAYDGPGTWRTACVPPTTLDMFSGAPDRYDWKLIGKKELYIPYNAYRGFAAAQVQRHHQARPHQPRSDSLRAAPRVGSGSDPEDG